MKITKNRIIFLLSALLFLSLAALALILFRGHSSSGETSYLETPDKAVYSVELKPFDTLNKGDRLLVFFTGSDQEIYPSQFENQLGYILLNDL